MTFHLDGNSTLPDGIGETVLTTRGTSGSDPQLNVGFEPATILSLALLGASDGGAVGAGPDGAADAVTVDGAALTDPSGLPEDANGRTAGLIEFGRNDTVTITGVSGNAAEVSFVGEGDGTGPIPDEFAGVGSIAVIRFDNNEIVFTNNSQQTPFADRADFNDRVTFGNGGQPQFTDTPTLSEIFDDFQTGGALPEAEIPGVFELPDEPPEGETIDVPPIELDVGGEPVTFDPGDPFWFDDLPAEAREEILADPELAVGYDYRIADPADGQAFATLRAPSVKGDTSYDLIVFNTAGERQPATTIEAGEKVNLEAAYDFPVTRFVIKDIDPQAKLDPEDGQAFPLAVSFTQDGAVDMQQTPLVRGFELGTDSESAIAETVSAFYVSYYGRAPDGPGLGFWIQEVRDQSEAGRNLGDVLADLSARFRDADETLQRYPFLDRDGADSLTAGEADQFITDLYNNLFERGPEKAGLDFWSDELVTRIENDAGIGDIITTIVRSSEGVDAVTIGNKLDVATEYAKAAADPGVGPDDLPAPEDVVDQVDDTQESVNQARAQIPAVASQADAVGAVGASSADAELMPG